MPHTRPAQASRALRPAGLLNRPRRPLSRGSSPVSCPTKPLVSYRSNRQLSGWNPPPLVIRAVGAHREMAGFPLTPPEGPVVPSGLRGTEASHLISTACPLVVLGAGRWLLWRHCRGGCSYRCTPATRQITAGRLEHCARERRVCQRSGGLRPLKGALGPQLPAGAAVISDG